MSVGRDEHRVIQRIPVGGARDTTKSADDDVDIVQERAAAERVGYAFTPIQQPREAQEPNLAPPVVPLRAKIAESLRKPKVE